MIYQGYKKLAYLRKKFSSKKIVFCTGTFDLTHAGHVLFFEECKKHGDILVVGVGNDRVTSSLKGKHRPVLNEHVRLKMVHSLKPVDFVFLDEAVENDHPLRMVEAAFKYLKPDYCVINNDGFDMEGRKRLANQYGVKLVIGKRTCPIKFDNISTSGIIEKINKD